MALRDNDVIEGQNILVDKIPSVYAPVKNGIDALGQLQVAGAQMEFIASSSRYATIKFVSLASILGGILFAGLSGFVLVRSINSQLGAESRAAVAQIVGACDLSGHIDLK